MRVASSAVQFLRNKHITHNAKAQAELPEASKMGTTTYLEKTMELSAITPITKDRGMILLMMFTFEGSDEEFQELIEKTESVFRTVTFGEKQVVKGAGCFEVNIAGTDEKRVLLGVQFSGTVMFSTFKDALNNGLVYFNFPNNPIKSALKDGNVHFPDETVFGKPPSKTFFFPMEVFYGTLPRGANSDGISEERMEELLTLTSDEIKELKKPKELVYLCLHYRSMGKAQHHQAEQGSEESDDESSGEESGDCNEPSAKKALPGVASLATLVQDALTNWEADAKRRRGEMEHEIQGLQVQVNDLQKQQTDWLVEKEGIESQVIRLKAEKAVLLNQINELTSEKVDSLTRAEAVGKKRARCVESATTQMRYMQKTLDELKNL